MSNLLLLQPEYLFYDTPRREILFPVELHWYNPSMANLYLIQLVGVILTTAGIIALIASAHIFGTPLSPAERKRASDEWNRRRDAYRLPINLEAFASMIFFLGGISILAWSKFNFCEFLAYWFPPLPELAKLLLSCR